MSSKICNVTGFAFHLSGGSIDTDCIIPARFLTCLTFDELGPHVFEDDREKLNGQHPFDQERNRNATVLIVDENFGSGSSREHAVHALTKWGIKAIIGKSFAQIFRGNATANGLPCVEVSDDDHRVIVEMAGNGEQVEIDLVAQRINLSYQYCSCTMPSADREMLVEGTWDTIATLLEAGSAIDATESRLPDSPVPLEVAT